MIFDGERGRVDLFLQTFNFYRNANYGNEVMRNPFQRSNLLLTLMKGPKIQNWAARKGEELTMAVFGDPANNIAATHQIDDERLWQNLLLELKQAYSEYHGAEDAYRKIKGLQQKPGFVDDYIVLFELLLIKAEWGRDQHGTISAFKEGLIEPLLRKCIERRPKPQTLTDWMQAAREEERLFYELKFDLGEAKRHKGRRRLDDMAHDASNRRGKRPTGDTDPRPYDPMQVDAARTQRMTPEERLKLIKEGKCFGCKETKHLYKDCPENPRNKRKGKGKSKGGKFKPRPQARVADTSASVEEVPSEEESGKEEEDNAPPAYTTKNLKAAIKKMSMEDREDLLDSVALDSDQDF
jgi:hypothetical protein